MRQDDDNDVFGPFRVPGTPDGLKHRVIEAASEALRQPARPTTWDLLWESRPLRAAWGVAILGLLVAHVLISLPTSGTPTAGATTGRGQLENLRDELDLPSVEVTPRAEALIMEMLKDEVQG